MSDDSVLSPSRIVPTVRHQPIVFLTIPSGSVHSLRHPTIVCWRRFILSTITTHLPCCIVRVLCGIAQREAAMALCCFAPVCLSVCLHVCVWGVEMTKQHLICLLLALHLCTRAWHENGGGGRRRGGKSNKEIPSVINLINPVGLTVLTRAS